MIFPAYPFISARFFVKVKPIVVVFDSPLCCIMQLTSKIWIGDGIKKIVCRDLVDGFNHVFTSFRLFYVCFIFHGIFNINAIVWIVK